MASFFTERGVADHLPQKEEELQFAVGAAVADLARSGPLVVPAGKVLEGMRVAARAARRKMKEEVVPETGGGQGKSAEGCGAVVDALDFVLHQVGVSFGTVCYRRECTVYRGFVWQKGV